MTKVQAMKWVKALRSGKYRQTRGTLQDHRGYCCLGVACKVFIPEHDQIKEFSGNMLMGSLSSQQPAAPAFLRTEGLADFNEKTGTTYTVLNDDDKYSFEEIADIIQLVYVEKARLTRK